MILKLIIIATTIVIMAIISLYDHHYLKIRVQRL